MGITLVVVRPRGGGGDEARPCCMQWGSNLLLLREEDEFLPKTRSVNTLIISARLLALGLVILIGALLIDILLFTHVLLILAVKPFLSAALATVWCTGLAIGA